VNWCVSCAGMHSCRPSRSAGKEEWRRRRRRKLFKADAVNEEDPERDREEEEEEEEGGRFIQSWRGRKINPMRCLLSKRSAG